VAEDDTKKQAISISEAWMAELQKHPYHSSKLFLLILVEKPGTGIFLMKESAKLHRPQKEREKKKLAKRLWAPSEASNDDKKPGGAQNKRQNLGGGQFAEVPPSKPGDTLMKSGMK
jgi:hypothetical protein